MTAARDRERLPPRGAGRRKPAASCSFSQACCCGSPAGFAGLAFGGHWPRRRRKRPARSRAATPRPLGRSASAWPVQARAGLPGPLGMYVALVAAGASWEPAFAVVLQVRHASNTARRRATPRRASWAKHRDLAPLRVTRARRRPTHAGTPRSAAWSPPSPGNRRSSSRPRRRARPPALAVPAILEWPGPVVAASVKNDLLRDTLAVPRATRRAFCCSTRRCCTGLAEPQLDAPRQLLHVGWRAPDRRTG